MEEKTYSHIRRQALNQAAEALEPTARPNTPTPTAAAEATSRPSQLVKARARGADSVGFQKLGTRFLRVFQNHCPL